MNCGFAIGRRDQPALEQSARCPHQILTAHFARRIAMPRGEKDSYTDKQKRQVAHIEEGYEKKGVPAQEAKRRAWATENKISGGGKKSGSGRGHK
jgi:hypothetical protein